MRLSASVDSTNVRASGICGILLAITFAVGGILLGDLFGSFADSDETFVEYFASSSNRIGSAVGGLFLFFSGIALIPFLRGLIRQIDPDGTSWAAELAITLSYLVAGLIVAGAAALSTVGMARTFADIFDEEPRPFQGSSIAVLPQLGYVLMVFAGWTLAGVLAIVGSVSLRTRTLPREVAWITIICAVLLLLAPSGAALFVVPVWALVTSIFMLRRRAPEL